MPESLEKRTGLRRFYTSRVENGHTVPSVETLEKYARALEIPLYRIFYDGEIPPKLPNYLKLEKPDDSSKESSAKDAQFLGRFRRALKHVSEIDRKLLLLTARKLARRHPRGPEKHGLKPTEKPRRREKPSRR